MYIQFSEKKGHRAIGVFSELLDIGTLSFNQTSNRLPSHSITLSFSTSDLFYLFIFVLLSFTVHYCLLFQDYFGKNPPRTFGQ